MTQLAMSPQVFAILSALVEERVGLSYGLSNKHLFEDKVALRAMDAGFESLLDYYYFLRYDPGGEAEFEALVEALVVGETYLFRELEQLELLVRGVVAPLVAEGRRPRVWSAACSTGEEPASLAMILESRGLLGRVDLLASDISQKALARARAGVFGVRAIRDHAPTPAWAQRFLETAGDRITVSPALLRAIDFRRVNLLDAAAVAALGTFDAIVCRNVLIYFNDAVARRVVEALAGALVPGGALLVGVSESLLRLGTSLACEEREGVFLYRKEAR